MWKIRLALTEKEGCVMRLGGKIALITGAGKGIGRTTAKRFAQEGAPVEIAELNGVAAREVVGAVHQVGLAHVDVSDPTRVERRRTQVLSRHRWGEVLFNSAGIGAVGALHDVSDELWDKVAAVNLTSVFRVARAFLPSTIAQHGGSIINMSSAKVDTGLVRRAAYSATKGATLAMPKSMQVDYAPYNLRVNALLPGTIRAQFVEKYLRDSYDNPEEAKDTLHQRQLEPELGGPKDITQAASYLASDEACYVWGSGLMVDGGTTAGKPY